MPKKFWKLQNKDEDTGELLLYGIIANMTWWGDTIAPKQFKEDLENLGEVSTINVHINSDGGDAFAGFAIYNMLNRHKAMINVYIDGMAASAASVIAMAGDTIYMPKNSMMMIHNAWTIGVGNKKDLRSLADDLEKTDGLIADLYADRSGQSLDKVVELLDAETLMTAKEAVELGFADEIEEEKQIAASLNGDIFNINGLDVDITQFKNFNPAFAIQNAASPDDFKGTPFADLPLVDEEWNPNGDTDAEIQDEILGKKKDWKAMKKAYISYAPGKDRGGDPPTQKDAYKLKIARRRNGKLTVYWTQLTSRVAILNGARGGVDISDKAKQEAWDHAMKYYDKKGIPEEDRPEPKWAKSSNRFNNEGRTLSAANKDRIVGARDKLNEVIEQLGDTSEANNRRQETPNNTPETQELSLLAYMERQLNEKRRRYN